MSALTATPELEAAMLGAVADRISRGGTAMVEVPEDVKAALMGEGAISATDALDSNRERTTLYDRYSGQSSTVLLSQVKHQLSKIYPVGHPWAGQRVFTWDKKETRVQRVQRQALLCPLHPEDDSELHDDLMALGVTAECFKANIPGEMHVLRHLEMKHPQTFKLLEDYRERKDRRETLDVQRQMLVALGGKAEAAPEPKGQLACDHEGCEYVTPVESKNPAASLRFHKQHHKD